MDIETILGDSEINILVKFVEPQFAETTMDGNFYFARNEYFINLEEQEENKGIADKHEGSWSRALGDNHRMFFEVDGKMIPIPFKTAVFRNRYDGLGKLPICCFVFLSLKKDFEVIPNTNKIKLKPEIEQSIRKQFLGRHLILFRDVSATLERFDKSIEQMNYTFSRKLVQYYDEKTSPHPLSEEDYEVNPIKALFYKSKFFEHQKEFRIVITKPQDNDVTVPLGDIRDIAVDYGLVETDKQFPFEITFEEAEEVNY